jgi:hypothetical protein
MTQKQDGYVKIYDELQARLREGMGRIDRTLRECKAGRMRESGSTGDGLIDRLPGVPHPDGGLASDGERAFDRLREGELLDLGSDIPKPEKVLGLSTYGGVNGSPAVAYETSDTYGLVTDLWRVLPQTLANGTPNLENELVEGIAASMQDGKPLSDAEIGVLRKLLDKYQSEIVALRADPDYQSYTDTPSPATARLVESARGRQTGLQPGGEQPDRSPGQRPCAKCDKGLMADGAVCSACKGSGWAPGKKQPLAESGLIDFGDDLYHGRHASPDQLVPGPDGLLDLGPGVPKPLPAFASVGYGRPAVNSGPTLSKMRSSASADDGLLDLESEGVPSMHPRVKTAAEDVAEGDAVRAEVAKRIAAEERALDLGPRAETRRDAERRAA